MKLFTDIDLDGLGCGIIAKLAFGDDAHVSYCTYRVLNQRVENFIDNSDFYNTETYITDLAVNEAVEKKLEQRHKEGHHIQMIDHHVTAMHFNQYSWGKVQPEYESGKKTCATSLFYDHLIKNNKMSRLKSLEEFIELVRQYDTWEWDINNNVAAKRLNDLFYILDRDKFEESLLKRIIEQPESFSLTETENLLLDIEEKKIDRYINSKNRQMVQATIDDYCVGIVHAEQYLSELGNALNKLNPHLDMIVLLNVGTKKAGFRTIHDHVNVAEFASKYGGGGHPKASGCDLSREMLEKFVVNVFGVVPAKIDADRNELNVKEAAYGTVYENRRGDISYLRPTGPREFEVIHNGKKVDENFTSFENGEHFIKRNYASWLRYDNDNLFDLSKQLSLPIDKVKKKYKELIKTAISNKKYQN
ncbi:DHH family phosphoesterase [Bacillus marasmi]|uniref:DHH family phosphoesterase n=1 Tax=Bacillus marasmi TaxID=1926279 RepID=UPI0011C7E8DA|nr:DHHA1 domain-containing protein [Bacillus marasmi]